MYTVIIPATPKMIQTFLKWIACILCNRLYGEEENIIGVPAHEPVPKTRRRTNKKPIGCRDMSKCFVDGQRIRHIIGYDHIWIATYDRSHDAIVHNGVLYKSPSRFATAHNTIELPYRKAKNANGWAECEYEENGEWKSTFNMTDRSVHV
jgi:hypothetical protein